jgi:DNA (cytosine-5)-methyltransferase 1
MSLNFAKKNHSKITSCKKRTAESVEQPQLFDLDAIPKDRKYTLKTFKFIDLFAGIGGMRMALEDNGGKCVFSSEWDKDARKTYEANFLDTPDGDITKIYPKNIPDHDVLAAGFPCQPFSSIGQRAGFKHKTQGTLFYDVLRIINAKRPTSILLENVKGLTTHDKGNTFRVIRECLVESGYEIFFKILDATDYGVPQKRERIYVVGFDKKKFKKKPDFYWPRKVDEHVGIGKFIEKNISNHSISSHLQKSYIYKHDDGRPQVVSKKSDFPVKTLVSTYHKIQRLTGTFVSDGPTGLRLLTANECKAIMGFPKSFKIPVSRTQMYRQLGNSVALPVVRAIAREILATIASDSA